jgi:plastocyanin
MVVVGVVTLTSGLSTQPPPSFAEPPSIDVAEPETALQQPGPAEGQPFIVTARQSSFEPGFPAVPLGTTVVWVNRDRELHTVTSDIGLFDLEVEPGARVSMTFTEAGVYFYFCLPHDWMIGEITVEDGQPASS